MEITLFQNTCFNDGDVNLVQFLQEIASEQQFEVTYVDIEEKSISGKFILILCVHNALGLVMVMHELRFKKKIQLYVYFVLCFICYPLSTISTSTSFSLVGTSSCICSLNPSATKYGLLLCFTKHLFKYLS